MGKEQEWFDKLTAKRTQLAKQLKDPAAAGFWHSVVDKYSDEAHFINELLQNSDDALASTVNIKLYADRIEYSHNGTVAFSISDPDKEGKDAERGHLNAITSIGASTKGGGNAIGKFGIGFKSVFRYTDCPHIEDDNFSFEIHDYIVPIKADRGQIHRTKGETTFSLPLKNAEKDYPDILKKLQTLYRPLLFLSHLRRIHWEADGKEGNYQLNILAQEQIGHIQYDFVQLKREVEETCESFLYHRYKAGCAIAISATETGDPQPLSHEENIFCFFPTKVRNPFPFVIHAPFLLTDNREGIKFHESWNQQQIRLLGEMAGDALEHLARKRLLGDHLFQIIPTDRDEFSNKNEDAPLAPIYDAIVQRLKSAALFVTDDGEYVDAAHTRYSSSNTLRELFIGANEYTIDLTEEPMKWAFRAVTEAEDEVKKRWLKYLQENQLIAYQPSIRDIVDSLSIEELEEQTIDWFKDFYICLAKSKYQLSGEAIFLCSDSKVRPLYEAGDPIPRIFLSEGTERKFIAIHPALVQDEKCRTALQKIGIKEPGLETEVFQNILPIYAGNRGGELSPEEHAKHLVLLYECYLSYPPFGEEQQQYLQQIKEIAFLPVSDYQGNYLLKRGSDCVLRSRLLNDYWEGCPEVFFLERETILSHISPEKRERFYVFLEGLGVAAGLEIQEVERAVNREISQRMNLQPTSLRQYDNGAQIVIDKEIRGWDFFIHHLTPKRSQALFQLLNDEIQRSTSFLFAQSLVGRYSYIEKGKQGRTEERLSRTTASKVLHEDPWLYNQAEIACAPNTFADTAQLSTLYSIAQMDIFFFLGIKIADELKELNREQREAIDIVNKFKAHGFTIRDMEEMLKERIGKGE